MFSLRLPRRSLRKFAIAISGENSANSRNRGLMNAIGTEITSGATTITQGSGRPLRGAGRSGRWKLRSRSGGSSRGGRLSSTSASSWLTLTSAVGSPTCARTSTVSPAAR